MRKYERTIGFTLVEILIVVVIIAIMLTVTLPAVVGMVRSQKMSSAQNLVRSLLAQARAYAAKEQKYAGVRFQQAANGRQYAVVIEHVANDIRAYIAVPNSKPLALPAGIGLISGQIDDNAIADKDAFLGDDNLMAGARTFSIIFSPTGQLVVKQVAVQQRDLKDKVFGSMADTETKPPLSLLSYDRYYPGTDNGAAPWCLPENSTTGMYIYDMSTLAEIPPGARYSAFFAHYAGEKTVKRILINIYTGMIMESAPVGN